MNRLEKIESEIQQLSPTELAALREWFADFDNEIWDQQLERDAKSGILDSLANQALEDHAAGRSTKL